MLKAGRISTAMVAAAALAAVAVPAQTATAATVAPAVGCYESAGKFGAEAGQNGDNAHFPNYGDWMRVLGHCNDINVKLETTRSTRVCTRNKCHPWVTATKNTWAVVFKNSVPGAEYYLQFGGSPTVVGLIAD
jgi:hypothetical protein